MKNIFILLIISIFLFCNCSQLHFASFHCTEGNTECEQLGNVDWLSKKPIDILVVLDNSEKMQKVNSQVTANLNQFLQCIEPVDWRLTVVSSVKKDGEFEKPGSLVGWELEGQIYDKPYISANTRDYEKIFFDTVSLNSGCEFPPYCEEGSNQPLSAVQNFLDNKDTYQDFLRENTTLTTVIVSSSDQVGNSSNEGIAQATLSSVLGKAGYGSEQFMNLTVMPISSKESNCIESNSGSSFMKKAGSVIWNVTKFAGMIYSAGAFGTALPGIMGVSILDNAVSSSAEKENTSEIYKFSKLSGGESFNLCDQDFGSSLSYMVLKKINIENRLPDECKEILAKRQEEQKKQAEQKRQAQELPLWSTYGL